MAPNPRTLRPALPLEAFAHRRLEPRGRPGQSTRAGRRLGRTEEDSRCRQAEGLSFLSGRAGGISPACRSARRGRETLRAGDETWPEPFRDQFFRAQVTGVSIRGPAIRFTTEKGGMTNAKDHSVS